MFVKSGLKKLSNWLSNCLKTSVKSLLSHKENACLDIENVHELLCIHVLNRLNPCTLYHFYKCK